MKSIIQGDSGRAEWIERHHCKSEKYGLTVEANRAKSGDA